MTYRCPVCQIGDPSAYLVCHRPDCTDGRDWPPRNIGAYADHPATDGNSYRYHATGLPAGGDELSKKQGAYGGDRRISPRYPSSFEQSLRLERSRARWRWAYFFFGAAFGTIAAILMH